MLHIGHFLKNIKHTGAVLPSSKYLANDIVEMLEDILLKKSANPLRILEIGPGTGIFTERISSLIRPVDKFDVVELNDHFFQLIKSKYAKPNVKVIHGDILQYEPAYTYDIIISSVPFESLPSEISEKIWQKKLELSHDGTYITYYKYVNFNRFRCKFEKEVVKQFQVDDKVVIRNLPPARLLTLCITGAGYAEAQAV